MPSPSPLRLLQITDQHLFAEPERTLLGQRTRLTLEEVLRLTQRDHGTVDRVLLTGDLSQDASPAAYLYLAERFAQLGLACHALPGNHDHWESMRLGLQGGPIALTPAFTLEPWRIVMLDSSLAGSESGHLAQDQLALLDSALAAHSQAPSLVCLHHQPLPLGSAWLDEMVLDNAIDFFDIIDRHPQVRAILFGHVHQEYLGERKGVMLLAAPSTCIQFLPGSDDFALDSLTPGFRWLELFPDGRILTGIERIPVYPDPLDLNGKGY